MIGFAKSSGGELNHCVKAAHDGVRIANVSVGAAVLICGGQRKAVQRRLGEFRHDFIIHYRQHACADVRGVEVKLSAVIRHGFADLNAVGQQTNSHVGNARFARILNAVAVCVLPDAIADFDGRGIAQHCDIAQPIGLAERAGQIGQSTVVNSVRFSQSAVGVDEPSWAAVKQVVEIKDRNRIEGVGDQIRVTWNLSQTAHENFIGEGKSFVAEIKFAAAGTFAGILRSGACASATAIAFQRPACCDAAAGFQGVACADAVIPHNGFRRIIQRGVAELIACSVAETQNQVAVFKRQIGQPGLRENSARQIGDAYAVAVTDVSVDRSPDAPGG